MFQKKVELIDFGKIVGIVLKPADMSIKAYMLSQSCFEYCFRELLNRHKNSKSMGNEVKIDFEFAAIYCLYFLNFVVLPVSF